MVFGYLLVDLLADELSAAITGIASARPITCNTINSGTDSAAIPAKESLRLWASY